MSAYGALAGWYDELTRDVDYGQFADYYEKVFGHDGGEYKMLLDLGCGTGSLTCILAERGYEMIAADSSPDMLMSAREKAAALRSGTAPLLICQSAEELDLYGTVDAAISSLDTLSYVPPENLPEVFRRLRLFVRPDGLVIFDLRTPEFLRGMDGSMSIDETDDVFCVWRGRFDAESASLTYGMDIFSRDGEMWRRSGEEHVEYAHEPREISRILRENGFTEMQTGIDGPQSGDGRRFYVAKRKA